MECKMDKISIAIDGLPVRVKVLLQNVLLRKWELLIWIQVPCIVQ